MRKSIWQPIAAFVATAVICVGSNALVASPASATSPDSITTVEQDTTYPMPNVPTRPVSSIHSEEREALRYMRSPERVAMFESDFKKAGVLIAKGLDAGKFAPVTYRYDDWKKDRRRGYTGWGGISTPDNSAYAWVYWLRNGGISYTKMGVTGFSISYGTTHLQIEQLDNGDGPYRVYFNEGGDTTRISSVYFGGAGGADGFVYTQDLTELQELDEDAVAALNTLMIRNFGVNWRQLR